MNAYRNTGKYRRWWSFTDQASESILRIVFIRVLDIRHLGQKKYFFHLQYLIKAIKFTTALRPSLNPLLK
jgi:hypothetical protein